MLLKFLLLVLLLFAALGVAVWLLQRLNNTMQQVADLRSQLVKNDEVLGAKLAALQEQKRVQETQEETAKSPTEPEA